MDNNQTWEGFSLPDKHFVKMPHDFIEAMSRIDSLAELKVVLYVMRHTWGFQEYDTHKKITTDEFMHGRKKSDGTRMDSGTGLSNKSIQDGTNRAIRHGYLELEADYRDRARVKKAYRLKMRDRIEEEDEVTPKIKKKSSKSRLLDLRAMPYAEYLKTPEWKATQKKALRYANFSCQLCSSAKDLNVHHRTYERLGEELPSDLTVLCEVCHGLFHRNRGLAR